MMFKKIIVATFCLSDAMSVPGLDDSDRYDQLLSTMQIFNSGFTAEAFWAYGCNCQMTHNIADPARGSPKDALDSTCKRYKGQKIKIEKYTSKVKCLT